MNEGIDNAELQLFICVKREYPQGHRNYFLEVKFL